MKKHKIVVMIILVCLFLMCLTGCGQKSVDVQTLLTLEQDNTGSRQITVSISKNDFGSFFDGTVDELNQQLETVCPSQLEWSFSAEEEQYSYIFTLYFSSMKDYREKVNKIIGRKVSVSMEEPDSVFASGVLYQEDFDSIELLGWLGDFLEKEGYLSKGQGMELFSESSAKVSFKGTEYEAEPGQISVDTLVRTPVERIDILSRYRQNKHCDRQVIFTFSSASMSKNGTEIREYMQKNKPEGARITWSDKSEGSLCTVSAMDNTAKQLDEFMKKLFGKSDSFISVQPQQRVGIFAAASDWSELVDVNDFSYNQNEKVAVGYYVQWDDGMDVTIRYQNSDETIELSESEIYGGYQKVMEKEILQESLITEVSTTYVIEDIEVDMEFHSTDNLSRSITLVFQAKPDQEDQERIRKRIAGKAKGIAEVSNGPDREDGRASIIIAQTGSVGDINDGFQAIFDVQGQLSHTLSGDLLEFQHSGSFADLMDFTSFLENDPLLTTLTYHLKLPGGEKIMEDSVSSTISLKQGTQEVKNGQYTGSVKGAYLSLTLSSEKWNTDGARLFLVLCGFVLVGIAIIRFADFLRKFYEHTKDGFDSFNKSFGKNEDMMEDFPEEGRSRNREKKEYLSVLKDKLKNLPLSGKNGPDSEPGTSKHHSPASDKDESDETEKSEEWKIPPQVGYEEQQFEESSYREEDLEEEGKEDTFNPESLIEKITEVSMETPAEEEKNRQ
ncbi:MAG: hypothetical protein PUG60_05845 [Lachnospiraceae bacterium]|nr:hypothetical protein [Lachnospiraceae bacterium]MDY4971018.1 hypothetical protein [Lachnospiraceae bacterium]